MEIFDSHMMAMAAALFAGTLVPVIMWRFAVPRSLFRWPLYGLAALALCATLLLLVADGVAGWRAERFVYTSIGDTAQWLGSDWATIVSFGMPVWLAAVLPAHFWTVLASLVLFVLAWLIRGPQTQHQGTDGLTAAPAEKPVKAGPDMNSRPLKGEDSEFLPAALEILVTPASPVATSLMFLICAGFTAGLTWAYFGQIDIHAVAPGKIQPSGRSQVVQPLEPGRVVAIHAENGAHVKAGDVLVELDPTELFADREAQARDLEAANAEAARRRVAIAAVEDRSLKARPIVFDVNVSGRLRERETDVLAADLSQLRSTRGSLQTQLAEKQATVERLRLSIEARARLIALSKERVEMRQQVETQGAGSRALVIEALQQHEGNLTQDSMDRGQLLEAMAAIPSLESKAEEVTSQYLADQTQKLAEAERRSDRLVQELIKAQSRSDRAQLKAPISGTVQQMVVNSVGQVVTGGQAVLTIVPVDGPIEVEAMIANMDIGFVKLKQTAIVKVDAFPFTRYGAIEAEVIKISRDAVDEQGASAMTDAATTARSSAGGAPTSRAQSLVYPATLRLSQRTILVEGEAISLMPGMSVTVEVRTGGRRMIDYILSPLRESASTAARER
jgi:hemolysin D